MYAAIDPVTGPLGFPAEALPMALLRPLSGSGAYGVMVELMKTHGPDSFLGILVGVIPVASAQADAQERRKLIYVFDKTSGTPLHAIELDAFSAAAPMTYMHGGKQYVVVAAGSGPTSELIALSVPDPTAG